MKKLSAIVMFLWLGATVNAFAHSYKQGAIEIGHAWARAMPTGATTTAIYVPLLNTGDAPDALTGVSSPQADKIEIHESTTDNHIAHMQMLNSVSLAPHQPIAMKPGGLHLMVFGLKHSLSAGDKFPLILRFEKAGGITIEAVAEGDVGVTRNH